MRTLYDFGTEVQKIREAINNITTKGAENASYVLYAHNKCNEIINSINALINEQQSSEGQNGENSPQPEAESEASDSTDMEEGEVEHGESDSGAPSRD